MTLYLTGFIIDSTAVLALGVYYLYYVIRKKELEESRHYFWLVWGLITTIVIVSIFFVWFGDLTLASVLVWLMAVPVIVTSLFILLIIIFRPDWN